MYRRLSLSLLFFFLLLTALFAQMREYYPNSIQGKKDKELKTELHKLIMVHERIPYGSYQDLCTWTVFRKSDVHENGSVWDMYSNNTYYFSNGSSSSTKGMNIEHSAPKSWWGEGTDSRNFQYDASFDLHHLVPSDASANSAKFNYILGEVVNGVTFDNGVSKVGNAQVNDHYSLAFEPSDEYKGDFARMYFYLVTCYQGEDARGHKYTWRSEGLKMFQNTEYPTLTTYGKELLLKWHRQDPVSVKEVNRNNAVYSFQNNRNPYIDYPNLVEYVWGEHVGEAYYLPETVHLIGYESGDVIDMPACKIGSKVKKVVHLKGEGFSSAISLLIEGNDFSVNLKELSAQKILEGVDVEIMFSPVNSGLLKSNFKISGKDLSETISLQLEGIAIPEKIMRVYPVDLNSVYNVSDGIVILKLTATEYSESPKWTGDGVSLNNGTYQFDPKSAGIGAHDLKWSVGANKGKVRIVVK